MPADDFEVSIFLTDVSAPHAILTRQKRFEEPSGPDAAGTRARPVDVDDAAPVPHIRRESSDEDKVDLDAIPLGRDAAGRTADEAVAVPDSDEDGPGRGSPAAASDADDKKKLGLTTSYEGFQIYGRILCLIVTRTGGPRAAQTPAGTGGGGGQAMMEEWIASTQPGGSAAAQG